MGRIRRRRIALFGVAMLAGALAAPEARPQAEPGAVPVFVTVGELKGSTSYVFLPGFVTVRQGDRVTLTAFVVNGDEHEIHVNGPDGALAVPRAV